MNVAQLFYDKYELEGGIWIPELDIGTKLTVSTNNSIYEMTIRGGILVDIQGGNKRNGAIRYPKPELVFIHGSYCDLHLQIGWIGFNDKIIIIDPKNGLTTQTSPVCHLKITSNDNSCSYEIENTKSNPSWKIEGF